MSNGKLLSQKIDPNRLNLLLRKLLPLSVRNWEGISPIEEVQAPILSHILSAAQPTIGGFVDYELSPFQEVPAPNFLHTNDQ